MQREPRPKGGELFFRQRCVQACYRGKYYLHFFGTIEKQKPLEAWGLWVCALVLSLLPGLGIAQPIQSETKIANVISAVGINWNSSGNFKAVLVREGEYAALYIYRGPFDTTPQAYAPQAAITGDYWATIPWLEFDEGGALLLHSENRAYGQNKWESTLTILEQNGRFIVSAYSFSSYNAFNPDIYTDCDIDMLKQSITLNGEPVDATPLPAQILIADWNEDLGSFCYTDN